MNFVKRPETRSKLPAALAAFLARNYWAIPCDGESWRRLTPAAMTLKGVGG